MRPVPSVPPLVVLGVDPGTHVCGWGVVSADGGRLRCGGYGVVRAPTTAPVERRLAEIARGLRAVIAKHAPTEAAIEEVFYGRDARAAVRLGEGRGAALVVLAEAGLPVTGYSNNAVKRSVTGAGRAEKARVQAMVRAILGLAEVRGPLDASDALAIAVCHHHGRRLPRARSGGTNLSPRIAEAVRAARATERARRAAAGSR